MQTQTVSPTLVNREQSRRRIYGQIRQELQRRNLKGVHRRNVPLPVLYEQLRLLRGGYVVVDAATLMRNKPDAVSAPRGKSTPPPPRPSEPPPEEPDSLDDASADVLAQRVIDRVTERLVQRLEKQLLEKLLG